MHTPSEQAANTHLGLTSHLNPAQGAPHPSSLQGAPWLPTPLPHRTEQTVSTEGEPRPRDPWGSSCEGLAPLRSGRLLKARRCGRSCPPAARRRAPFPGFCSIRAQELDLRNDSRDPQIGPGAFSGLRRLRTPLCAHPDPGVSGKVTRRTDTARQSASHSPSRAPSYTSARGAPRVPQSFPSAPRKVSEEQSSPVAVAGGMAGEESSQSAFPPMAHQGRRKKTENQRKKKRSRPTFPVAAPPRVRSGPGRGLPGAGRGSPGGRAPGGRALTSVGARERRAPRSPSGRSWLRQPPL